MINVPLMKKACENLRKPLKFLAEKVGFEPTVPFEYTRFPIVLLRPARTPLLSYERRVY